MTTLDFTHDVDTLLSVETHAWWTTPYVDHVLRVLEHGQKSDWLKIFQAVSPLFLEQAACVASSPTIALIEDRLSACFDDLDSGAVYGVRSLEHFYNYLAQGSMGRVGVDQLQCLLEAPVQQRDLLHAALLGHTLGDIYVDPMDGPREHILQYVLKRPYPIDPQRASTDNDVRRMYDQKPFSWELSREQIVSVVRLWTHTIHRWRITEEQALKKTLDVAEKHPFFLDIAYIYQKSCVTLSGSPEQVRLEMLIQARDDKKKMLEVVRPTPKGMAKKM